MQEHGDVYTYIFLQSHRNHREEHNFLNPTISGWIQTLQWPSTEITIVKLAARNQEIYPRSPKYAEGFPVGENMSRIMSISHKIANSLAFLVIPVFRLAKVIWRLLLLSSLLIFNLTLPIIQAKEDTLNIPILDQSSWQLLEAKSLAKLVFLTWRAHSNIFVFVFNWGRRGGKGENKPTNQLRW